MRGHFETDFFSGHFGPRFGMSGPFGCPFRGDFPGHHGPWTFGHFGPRFDHSPERHGHPHHGPEHHKRGPPEDHHRRHRCGHHNSDSDSDGPAERLCHGPPGFRRHGGRHHDFHGHGPSCHNPRPRFEHHPKPPCFGGRGPSEFPDRPWRGPWAGPWGADHHMHGIGRRFGHRKPCPYDSEERPPRKTGCDKCRENQTCCSGDKDNRRCGKGRKENRPCNDKDKDQNPGETVFVQRIVLEKATRPQSV